LKKTPNSKGSVKSKLESTKVWTRAMQVEYQKNGKSSSGPQGTGDKTITKVFWGENTAYAPRATDPIFAKGI